MALISPTITALSDKDFMDDLQKIKMLAPRIHIDLMDGTFAPVKSVSLDRISWPLGNVVDIHLMYQYPADYLKTIEKMSPRMVIVHNEANVHHMHFAAELHKQGILAGLAILQDTPIENAYQIMHSFDQVLIFSGRLGYHGGTADLNLLDKVKKVRDHHPEAEIAWDGGINAQNVARLVEGGVDILYVGGFIDNDPNPRDAYDKLNKLVVKI